MDRLLESLSCLEQVDDGTIRARFSRATLNGDGKQALDLGQIGNLRADLIQVKHGNSAHLAAGRLAGTAKLKDRPHLVGRKTEIPCASDEAERANIGLTVNAVAAFGARRLRQDSNPLEIADRLQVDAGAAGELAARETADSLNSGRHVDFP